MKVDRKRSMVWEASYRIDLRRGEAINGSVSLVMRRKDCRGSEEDPITALPRRSALGAVVRCRRGEFVKKSLAEEEHMPAIWSD